MCTNNTVHVYTTQTWTQAYMETACESVEPLFLMLPLSGNKTSNQSKCKLTLLYLLSKIATVVYLVYMYNLLIGINWLFMSSNLINMYMHHILWFFFFAQVITCSCFFFSPSPIFAISRALNIDLLQGLLFAVYIFNNFSIYM